MNLGLRIPKFGGSFRVLPACIITEQFKLMITKAAHFIFILFFAFSTNAQTVETLIGTTTYDLQSSASIPPRLVQTGTAMSAVWTYSAEASAYNDRGTGYNFFNGVSWGPIPGSRIENVRTGWPSVMHAGAQEFVISHDGVGGLKMSKRTVTGSGAWIVTDIPNPTGMDLLWARAVVGGINGQTIHLICLTEPLSLGGTTYNGTDGALLYYRSVNAGASWDIQALQIPGTEASQISRYDPDSYSIHVRDNKIAIGIFSALQDSFVLISNDDGTSWAKTLLVDFDTSLYQIDNWADADFDGLPDIVFNTDGCGQVFIDESGVAHAFYGAMYYTDDVLDGTYQFYPTTDGLVHWREEYGALGGSQIISAWDINGNGAIDVSNGQLPIYGCGLTTQPSVGQGENGTLYLIYSSVAEDRISSGGQVYRHIYLLSSADGTNWSGSPVDLTPDLAFTGYEYFFATIAPEISNKIHFIVQRDTQPGLSVNGDLDISAVNHIVHFQVTLQTEGCTNPIACNYDPSAVQDDGSCSYPGCSIASACNYNDQAGCDDGSCIFPGCSDAAACNYNPFATCMNNSLCVYPGCNIPGACNYDASAMCNDGSCTFPGCNDVLACNYNPYSSCDDGSCVYNCSTCPGDMNSDGARNISDMLLFLAVFGIPCE